MCTTIGFSYKDGIVFGRTLEVGMPLDNHILFVPKSLEGFIQAIGTTYSSKYAVLGTGFFKHPMFGDGINEMGLMGSNNLYPGYATFATHPVENKVNLTIAPAFNYLLSRCKNVEEIREEANKMRILAEGDSKDDVSTEQHFFFMDAEGNGIVLQPKDGELLIHENPYGVLTNSPEFPWHVTNLRNYIHLQPDNVQQNNMNGVPLSKFGEGSGMVGLPGDFTPPSRFVRAASFVSATPKDLERKEAILQGFRILSQSDIPTGAVIDPIEGHRDETLYTAIMDTKKKAYFIKFHDNINIQPFYLDDYSDEKEALFFDIEKTMNL